MSQKKNKECSTSFSQVCFHPGMLLNYVLIICAVFINFRRNPQFDLGSFLAALFFAPLYLVYVYAKSTD